MVVEEDEGCGLHERTMPAAWAVVVAAERREAAGHWTEESAVQSWNPWQALGPH